MQGFLQASGDQHYRVRATGGGNALAYSKAGSQALNAGTWNFLTLATLEAPEAISDQRSAIS